MNKDILTLALIGAVVYFAAKQGQGNQPAQPQNGSQLPPDAGISGFENVQWKYNPLPQRSVMSPAMMPYSLRWYAPSNRSLVSKYATL